MKPSRKLSPVLEFEWAEIDNMRQKIKALARELRIATKATRQAIRDSKQLIEQLHRSAHP